MRKLGALLAIISITAFACKVKPKTTTKEEAVTTTNTANAMENKDIEGKTLGRVSHQYRNSGCATVIEVILADSNEIQTLIPKDKLAQDIDVDNMMIYFTFHTLRMPQPEGCSVGQPAEINDIVKK